jgi:AhpD family alkylhydroperoxidase
MSLDTWVKTLISIGTSVGANCQPCLQYHVAKAKEIGINEGEIQEAINVGRTVRTGAANKMDQYSATVCGKTSMAGSAGKGCGCGCDGE